MASNALGYYRLSEDPADYLSIPGIVENMHPKSVLIVDISGALAASGPNKLKDARKIISHLTTLARSRGKNIAVLADHKGLGSLFLSGPFAYAGKKDPKTNEWLENPGAFSAHASLAGRVYFAKAARAAFGNTRVPTGAIRDIHFKSGENPDVNRQYGRISHYLDLTHGKEFGFELSQGGFGGFQEILLDFLRHSGTPRPSLMMMEMTYWRPLGEAKLSENFKLETIPEIREENGALAYDHLALRERISQPGEGIVYFPNPTNPGSQQLTRKGWRDLIHHLHKDKLLIFDHTLVQQFGNEGIVEGRRQMLHDILSFANNNGKKVAVVWSASKALAIPEQKVGGILWSKPALAISDVRTSPRPFMLEDLKEGVDFLSGKHESMEIKYAREAHDTGRFLQTIGGLVRFVRPRNTVYATSVFSSFHGTPFDLPPGLSMDHVIRHVPDGYLKDHGLRSMTFLGGRRDHYDNYIRLAAAPEPVLMRVINAVSKAVPKAAAEIQRE